MPQLNFMPRIWVVYNEGAWPHVGSLRIFFLLLLWENGHWNTAWQLRGHAYTRGITDLIRNLPSLFLQSYLSARISLFWQILLEREAASTEPAWPETVYCVCLNMHTLVFVPPILDYQTLKPENALFLAVFEECPSIRVEKTSLNSFSSVCLFLRVLICAQRQRICVCVLYAGVRLKLGWWSNLRKRDSPYSHTVLSLHFCNIVWKLSTGRVSFSAYVGRGRAV